jgi:hypothetical protein
LPFKNDVSGGVYDKTRKEVNVWGDVVWGKTLASLARRIDGVAVVKDGVGWGTIPAIMQSI